MRRPCVYFVLLAVLAGLSPLFAETYAEFSDGRYLAIRGHEIGDGWVRLELTPGSWMVIPAARVTRIDGERGALWVRNEPTKPFLKKIRAVGQADRAVARRAGYEPPAAADSGPGDRSDTLIPPIR